MPKDDSDKSPTVGPQAEINFAAMGLVTTWLAKGWILQPQEPNYHEDYVIEHVAGGELSGAKISAQLKGHATVKFKEGVWPEVMKTKHLRYYATKAVVPVFLFVVDTTKRRGYYLFLQEWLDHHATATQLTNQKKLTIKVPLANNLEDQVKFLVEVKAAFAYMAKKYPSSIEDAMAGETNRIAVIDPRWNVKLDVVKGSKLFTLEPKQTMAMTLKVSGANVAKMKEHFDYGRPVELAGDAATLEGLPLIAELAKEKGGIASIAVTPAQSRTMEMHLWTDGANGFRLTLPGHITGGGVGFAFIATLPGTPLRAEMKVGRAVVKAPSGEGNFSLTFDFAQWEGRSIRTLPYFDRIRGFAEAIVENRLIQTELSIDGNRVTGGHLGNPKEAVPFTHAAAVVANIAKARQIADLFRLEIRLPNLSAMLPEEFEVVDYAHGILLGGGFSARGVGFNAQVTLVESNAPGTAVQRFESLTASGAPFTYTQPSQPLKIYGVPATLGDLTFSIQPVTATIPEPGRTEYLAGRVKTAPATIASVPNSVLTVTKQP